MRQFIRDNLLTKNSNLKHDDCFATEDETLSPTAERLVVLRWLDLLHSPLPNHIANVFSHELQNHSLKDIQLLVVTQINSLLNDVIQKEDNVSLIADGVKNVNIQRINNYSSNRKSSSQFRSDSSKRPYTGKYRPTQRIKKCTICKAAKEPFIGHEGNECSFIDPIKKSDFTKIYLPEYEQESL